MAEDAPIITTLLDVDAYKITMSDMIRWAGHEDVEVGYELRNRVHDTVHLGRAIDAVELREQLAAFRDLKLTAPEMGYLRTLGYLDDDLITYLAFRLRLPEPEVEVDAGTGELRVEVSGRWIDAIWWEIPILSIVSELYYRAVVREQVGPSDADLAKVHNEGLRRLREKIQVLKRYPQLTFMEFGTRRRFSHEWQAKVLELCMEEIPKQIDGTSNVDMARRYHLKPMGTMAHELFMVYQGIHGGDDRGLLDSQQRVVRDWWDRFRQPLSIVLPDTVGSDWFFENCFTAEDLRHWWGSRQDSGDPYEYAEKRIAQYQAVGVDPRRKMVVFSDGLDVATMTALWERFSDRVRCGYGWGTNLTNDLGFPAVSMVVKTVRANGRAIGKLTDNPAKAIGEAAVLERLKRVFNYSGGEYEPLRY